MSHSQNYSWTIYFCPHGLLRVNYTTTCSIIQWSLSISSINPLLSNASRWSMTITLSRTEPVGLTKNKASSRPISLDFCLFYMLALPSVVSMLLTMLPTLVLQISMPLRTYLINPCPHRRYKYFAIAKKLLKPLDDPDLYTVQTLILMVIYLMCSYKMSLCYTHLGAALRAAQRLGLHRKLEYKFTPIELEERKRTFWAAYNIERFTLPFIL
jgi:hypothetical protein